MSVPYEAQRKIQLMISVWLNWDKQLTKETQDTQLLHLTKETEMFPEELMLKLITIFQICEQKLQALEETTKIH